MAENPCISESHDEVEGDPRDSILLQGVSLLGEPSVPVDDDYLNEFGNGALRVSHRGSLCADRCVVKQTAYLSGRDSIGRFVNCIFTGTDGAAVHVDLRAHAYMVGPWTRVHGCGITERKMAFAASEDAFIKIDLADWYDCLPQSLYDMNTQDVVFRHNSLIGELPNWFGQDAEESEGGTVYFVERGEPLD